MQEFFLLTVSTAMPTCIFERMPSGVFAENFSLPHTAAVIQQAATIDGGTMMNFSSERICQDFELIYFCLSCARKRCTWEIVTIFNAQ